ncbi:MAG: Zinc transporter ZitB [Candidatus Erwinia impunctatus]|nr:Zinc transporter ZitB [Culicoides impunctatus]
MAHSHSASRHNQNRLLAALLVTALFMLLEVASGLFSGSLALLADAGHMLTDAAALLMACLAVTFSRLGPDTKHTYGLLRLTTLAAFVNSLALLVITGVIIWEAIQRFSHPQPIAGKVMLAIAFAGLIANLVSLWLLRQGEGDKNLNVRATALHVSADLLGFVGAIAAALIIMFTGWTPIDPILSILVCLLILRSAWGLLKESLRELLEGVPVGIDIEQLTRSLKSALPEIRKLHHIHLWQVGEQPLITLHAEIDSAENHDLLLQQIHAFLYQHYNIQHATVQIESHPCEAQQCQLISSTPSHRH